MGILDFKIYFFLLWTKKLSSSAILIRKTILHKGFCVPVCLKSKKPLLKFPSLQNQAESVVPGSASVKLAPRCCTCVFAGRNIRKTYCQTRLAIAFGSILVLPLNTFFFLRMFLIHSRWREALIVESNAIRCQRLACTLAWDKVLFHLDIIHPVVCSVHDQSSAAVWKGWNFAVRK